MFGCEEFAVAAPGIMQRIMQPQTRGHWIKRGTLYEDEISGNAAFSCRLISADKPGTSPGFPSYPGKELGKVLCEGVGRSDRRLRQVGCQFDVYIAGCFDG